MRERPELMPDLDRRALADTARRAALAGSAALRPFMAHARAGAARPGGPPSGAADLEVTVKSTNDFVTAADYAAERAIAATISAEHPAHAILGEELSHATLDGPGPTWIVDPLDGTTNFIHGYPMFAVSVACAIGGRVVAGAVYDPSRDEMFSAAAGDGALCGATRIRVSGRPAIGGGLIATGFPFRRLHRLEPFLGAFRAVMQDTAGIRRAGSAALDLCHVACGRFDGFWEEGLGPWDVAAGTLIVIEAGGVVTDFRGGERYLTTGALVAATPGVHAELRARVEKFEGDGQG